jgi:hypothetical protein
MNPSGGELSEGPGFGCSLGDARGGSRRGAPWPLAPAVAVLLLRRWRTGPGARRRGAARFATSAVRRALWLCLSACTPTEIAEERFQSRAQTCYEFPAPGDAGSDRRFTSGLVRRDGCDGPGGAGAGGGFGAAPSAGGGAAGAADAASGRTTPSSSAGGGGAGATPALSGGSSDPDAGLPSGVGGAASASPLVLPADCTEAAVLEQLSRPYDMGGCTDPGGTGCHEDGTGEDPILQYPEQIVDRLLDQRDADGCGEVWIPSGVQQPDQSFLWRRLTQNVSDEDCEAQMPLDEDPLDPAALSCISAWILWVANGRPE